jgi:hypothetical protein
MLKRLEKQYVEQQDVETTTAAAATNKQNGASGWKLEFFFSFLQKLYYLSVLTFLNLHGMVFAFCLAQGCS